MNEPPDAVELAAHSLKLVCGVSIGRPGSGDFDVQLKLQRYLYIAGLAAFVKLCHADCRAVTKTDRLLAAYEHFGASIAGVPDKLAQDLYRTSLGAREFVADVRVRHPKTTSSQIGAGLEQGLRETPQLIKEIAPEWRAFVPRAFHDALAREYPAFIVFEVEILKKVLARGKIRSETEFYCVRHEIDVLKGEPSRRKELVNLYALVDAFEARA